MSFGIPASDKKLIQRSRVSAVRPQHTRWPRVLNNPRPWSGNRATNQPDDFAVEAFVFRKPNPKPVSSLLGHRAMYPARLRRRKGGATAGSGNSELVGVRAVLSVFTVRFR